MKNFTPYTTRIRLIPNAKFLLPILLLFISSFTAAQQKIIRLYDGPAPGSETWNWKEAEGLTGPPMPVKKKITYNVTNPSLVVFTPNKSNGVAVIISPGGSYHVLNTEHEGTHIAKELNKKGITVFLFKYRLVRSLTNDPWREMMEARKNPDSLRQKTDSLRQNIRTMARNDLNRAIVYVRKHASEYKIDPNRIGIMGFSAGGFMVANVAYNFTPDARPDFVAPIYSVITGINDRTVKPDAPPLFIAAATNDSLARVINSVNLYTDWINAKKSAELHLYANGGHGLHGIHASTWINRFVEWLDAQGFLHRNK